MGSHPGRGNGMVFSPEMPFYSKFKKILKNTWSPWGSVSYRPSASPSYEASSHVKNYAYSGKLLLLLLAIFRHFFPLFSLFPTFLHFPPLYPHFFQLFYHFSTLFHTFRHFSLLFPTFPYFSPLFTTFPYFLLFPTFPQFSPL